MSAPNPSTPEATKHTPGPWKLHYDSGDCEGTLSIRMATAIKSRQAYNSAHEVILYEGTWPDENDDHAEMLANARLITAAPDMLAQLKKIRNWLIGNADILEKAAKTHERFQSVADEELANAKNYRVTAKVVDATISKAESGQ